MDVTTTPEGIIAALGNQWQCRETQIKQLAALLPVRTLSHLLRSQALTIEPG